MLERSKSTTRNKTFNKVHFLKTQIQPTLTTTPSPNRQFPKLTRQTTSYKSQKVEKSLSNFHQQKKINSRLYPRLVNLSRRFCIISPQQSATFKKHRPNMCPAPKFQVSYRQKISGKVGLFTRIL